MKRSLAIVWLVMACFGKSAAQEVINPVLSGFYPDPSICRAGNDYYLVVSSFAYYPGLPIFHSTDLVNWKPLGGALNRPEQLNLDGAGISRGLFAPSIHYHNGIFYIVCTLVDKGGNFVITATNPQGPWSNPVWLPEVDGIDPSLYFDADGKAFIVYNSVPPDNRSLYDGHRTIRINEFDPVNLKVISDNRILINGGTDISKKPVWIEAPHIIKKDGWYYLICAEGGTAYNHSEVVFRSRSLLNPFIPYDKNPILTQRHLDPKRPHPVTTAGHADFVQTPAGDWWAVFLACRPYQGDFYNTGRETFIAPVQWQSDGWPVINPGFETVQYRYPIPAAYDPVIPRLGGNYVFRDEFDAKELSRRYTFLRTVRTSWYRIHAGALHLSLLPETCRGTSNPAFIALRQPHLEGEVSTAVRFTPAGGNEKAGLLLFQNELHYYYLCLTQLDGKPHVALYKGPGNGRGEQPDSLLAAAPVRVGRKSPLYLKAEARGSTYNFLFARKPGKWESLATGVDAKFLSTQVARGFVGVMYALYATSEGRASVREAAFDWVETRSYDAVYGQQQ
ncbi:MAG TPA: glycoside hydrolase family 43 protein [Lacibacter sp.]|nr:glycoside hydrolase family 43 protein [Lacibacter sp.]HMO89213.1 glycoside hydrolase family 43 protein [Lacibacter sp.]HMP86405.1 glycoside hydrolase family 43 protein [Lacibacter sp.]